MVELSESELWDAWTMPTAEARDYLQEQYDTSKTFWDHIGITEGGGTSASHFGYMVGWGFFPIGGAMTQSIAVFEGGGSYSDESSHVMVSFPKVVAANGVVAPAGSQMWLPKYTPQAFRFSRLEMQIANAAQTQTTRIRVENNHFPDVEIPAGSTLLTAAAGASAGGGIGSDLVWNGATGEVKSTAGGTFQLMLNAAFGPL